MNSFDHASAIVKRALQSDLNEADTRYQIIDAILNDVLGWPKECVRCEKHTDSGYADFILAKGEVQYAVIEAKRQGVNFEIPNSFNLKENTGFVKMEILLTDDNIRTAVLQVQRYCINEGIQFAAITNGNQWVWFKAFDHGSPWKKQIAFVIKTPVYFQEEFTKAVNIFSYSNIVERGTLRQLLSHKRLFSELYYPKHKILNYTHDVYSNKFAKYLTSIGDKYFGEFSHNDQAFMENCYVRERQDRREEEDVQQLFYDSLSPYFLQYKIKQLLEENKDGKFEAELIESTKTKTSKLITLFGGKGAGKSTFINRVLYFNPPRHLLHFGKTVLVDLLNVEEDKSVIQKHIWDQLRDGLDTDKSLDKNRDDLVALFDEEFNLADKQELFGFSKSSPDYNLRLNQLVTTWKSDSRTCVKALVRKVKNSLKGIVIAIDNTDQYDPKIQDFCFVLAKSISSELDCVCIIAMREERFFQSNIHGTLDAYKVTGFHISSPKPQNVFLRRIEFVVQDRYSPDRALLRGLAG